MGPRPRPWGHHIVLRGPRPYTGTYWPMFVNRKRYGALQIGILTTWVCVHACVLYVNFLAKHLVNNKDRRIKSLIQWISFYTLFYINSFSNNFATRINAREIHEIPIGIRNRAKRGLSALLLFCMATGTVFPENSAAGLNIEISIYDTPPNLKSEFDSFALRPVPRAVQQPLHGYPRGSEPAPLHEPVQQAAASPFGWTTASFDIYQHPCHPAI